MKKTARKRRSSNNVTLALDEDLLLAGRDYAKRHDTTLNALIRNLLAQTVQSENAQWIDECFRLMDRHPVHFTGKRWRREDLYDV